MAALANQSRFIGLYQTLKAEIAINDLSCDSFSQNENKSRNFQMVRNLRPISSWQKQIYSDQEVPVFEDYPLRKSVY